MFYLPSLVAKLEPCLTHLGLPLCLTKPRIEYFVPMLKRIENRLLGCSTLLSTRDKLTLIKLVFFSSMPIFFICSLMIPKTVVKQINIYLKQCFCRRYDTQEKGAALISWEKVSKPQTHGGLGALDITTHNQALLMKYLHKFLNGEDIPWVNIIWESHYSNNLPGDKMVGSFWWTYVLMLLPTYKQFARCKAGKGDTAMFWSDKWMDQPRYLKYLELYSFTNNKDISQKQVLELQETSQLFHRPLSQQAFMQFNSLQVSINNRDQSDAQDQWLYP